LSAMAIKVFRRRIVIEAVAPLERFPYFLRH
jgi:hypothetical protein